MQVGGGLVQGWGLGARGGVAPRRQLPLTRMGPNTAGRSPTAGVPGPRASQADPSDCRSVGTPA